MASGDFFGDMVLGKGHGRTYTKEEQAAYSQKYPSIVWRDGVPYVPKEVVASTSSDPSSPDYTGPNTQYDAGADANNTGGMIEADLSDPSFLAQLGRYIAFTSAVEAGAGQFGGGGVGGGASSAGGGGTGLVSASGGAAVPGMEAAGAMVPATSGVVGGIGGGVGGGTAAASSGVMGALSKYGPMASGLAKALGGAAEGSASAQSLKGALQNQQYGTQQNAQMQGGQLDLQRQQFASSDQSSQMKKALVAALLGNMGDVNVSVPGIQNASVGGGMRPSALNKDILAQIQAQGLKNGTTPKTWTGGEILTPPPVQTGGNKGLNTAALIASIIGAGEAGKQAYGK